MSNISKLLATRRWCYTIVETQEPKEHGGYVPSLVIEGEQGHRPMLGRNGGAPWVWGKTLKTAQETCRAINDKRGVTPEIEAQIVLSTL